ncbi:unnamed protein product [Fusarium equiseti]|uniref:Uncharacterized protein n=1 Tax=Fusarium equiseti TaxID=61235 RepID=A0A8J2IR50_FUSEQ|nr:unnamed protein product [Fusarium equiseti]
MHLSTKASPARAERRVGPWSALPMVFGWVASFDGLAVPYETHCVVLNQHAYSKSLDVKGLALRSKQVFKSFRHLAYQHAFQVTGTSPIFLSDWTEPFFLARRTARQTDCGDP